MTLVKRSVEESEWLQDGDSVTVYEIRCFKWMDGIKVNGFKFTGVRRFVVYESLGKQEISVTSKKLLIKLKNNQIL